MLFSVLLTEVTRSKTWASSLSNAGFAAIEIGTFPE